MPKGDEPSRADDLWIKFAVLQSEEIEGAIALSPRDSHACKHVLAHLIKMSLGNVVTLVSIEAAPIYNGPRQGGPSGPGGGNT